MNPPNVNANDIVASFILGINMNNPPTNKVAADNTTKLENSCAMINPFSPLSILLAP